ncbi:DarT ssDNA thymidine ADP-ribosyltransferase family protein [Leifsonia sp. Root112D2]|uniref:DarT ssDNA thymidine ADP-ribosyltransferase family protein n=1 Tax=Leifsonia sp. Root112D2 TaxID=1736426 RepID=UPI00138F0735|nr:DarT ssDNA thymidine ADP-ribosyltransferase family protein [Leifsonia sp. Root112D2]
MAAAPAVGQRGGRAGGRARTAGRTATSVVTTASASRSAGAKAAAAKRHLDVGEQRIYHLTHISNLAGILERGAMLADASEGWESRPAVDIASAANREARRSMMVAGESEPSVAGYVPFFLSPNAGVWESIRTHAADPRLSSEAYGHDVYDYVILVSTVKTAFAHTSELGSVDDASVMVANGDATATFTRFATSHEASERMLRIMRADEESEAMLAAEFLVRDAFPIEHVTLIGVANDKVRQAVRAVVSSSQSPHRPKVAVYPPWFQSAAENGLSEA